MVFQKSGKDIMNYIDWLNYKDLEYRDGVLYFAGLNILGFVGNLGTPIYIMNK